MEEVEAELHIGDARCAVSRYRGYKRYPGDVMEVYFDAPRQVVRIEGEDNIEYAMTEIQDVLSSPDRAGVWNEIWREF